jgi:hypothetical protein
MPIAKPCFPSQVSRDDLDKAMTPERVAKIWKYAKAEYIDKGANFEHTLDGVANDLGMPRDWVARAFTKPKALRSITNEIYDLQDRRLEAMRQAKAHVAAIDSPKALNLIRTVASIPRRALTFGHGPVFMVTHALDVAGRPITGWKSYFTGMSKAWQFASRAEHAASMDWLTHHDLYAMTRRSGLRVDPAEGPQGVLIGGSGGWARRAWDALKITRMMLFEREWQKIPENQRNLDTAKAVSNVINHATGVMSPGEWGFGVAEKAMFAPKLTASKWAKSVVDPIKTIQTVSKIMSGKGADVPFAERYAASMRIRNATEYMAFMASMYAVNQAILSASGSKDKVNWTDPTKSDWLRFKFAGHTLNTRGTMEVARLLGSVIAISGKDKKELHGHSKLDAIRDSVSRYAEYKAAPLIGDTLEIGLGQDVFGRPVPWSNDPGTKAKPRFTTSEYVLSKGPIYLGGATREIYDTLRERGIPATDALSLIHALKNGPDILARGALIGLGEAVGGGLQRDYSADKKPSGSQLSIKEAGK